MKRLLFIIIALICYIAYMPVFSDAGEKLTAPEKATKARSLSASRYSDKDIDFLISCLDDFTGLVSTSNLAVVFPQPDTTPSKEAKEALIRIGKPTVPKLLEILDYGSHGQVRESVEILGEIRDPSALARLKSLAKSQKQIDIEAIIAIAKIEKEASYDMIMDAFKRAEKDKRPLGGYFLAMGFSQDERFLEVLEEQLKKYPPEGKNNAYTSYIIQAIGYTHSEKAIRLLTPYTDSDIFHIKEASRQAIREIRSKL